MQTNSRFALFASVSLLALTGALAGCTVSSGSSSDPGSSSGTSECSAEGTGTINVVVSGLPEGVAAKVKVSGTSGSANDVTASATFADRPAGNYTATAERVAKPDPIVRTLYEPTVSTASFCLAGAATQTVTISYAEVGSSNKLWSGNANNDSGQFLGFAGADLTASGSPSAKVALKGTAGGAPGKSVAFDKEGNLWSLGATVGDAALLRFPASSLGTSGEKTADRKINPDFGGCGPALTNIAFDPSGALWGTVLCSDKILRIAPETLNGSSDYTPSAEDFATATGMEAPHGIAFDKDGNMWIADATSLRRFPAASLAAGQAHVSDFELKAKAENEAPLAPDALAFDKDGNLWASNFGGNVIYKLTPAELTPDGASKELVPSIAITIGVGALIEGLAFDEGGGLWLTYSQGKLARLGPDQLGTSTGAGDPTAPSTVTTSADIGSAVGLAFFPAPAALPLYSRFE